MKESTLRIRCLGVVSAVTLLAVPALAGVIKGRVCDDGREAPKDGLSGVNVEIITADGGKIDGDPTAADGTYEVNGIPVGDATVRLTKLGYARHPTEIHIQVADGENNVEHTWMWMTDPDDLAYYSVVSHHILRRVRASDDKNTAYVAEWIYLTAANLSPAFKRKLAVEIDKLDDSAKKAVPIIDEYLATTPESIERLQAICSAVAENNAEFPNQDKLQTLGITSSIFGETVLWKAYDPSVTLSQRRAFARSFGQAWTLNSQPATALRAWYETPVVDSSMRKKAAADEYKTIFEFYRNKTSVLVEKPTRFP